MSTWDWGFVDDRMSFQITIKRTRNAVVSLSALLYCSLFTATASQALNDGDLQRAIIDARVLGDVGASVKSDGTTVMVSTFLTARDTVNTCKAKAVLVAKTMFERVKTLALVRCVFFTPNNNTQYVSVDVGEGAIKSFADGKTTMTKLIASIPYQDTRGASSAASAPGQNTSSSGAASTLPGLVPPKGNVQISRRQAQIKYMEALQGQGMDVRAAVREFNAEQTAVDSGDLPGYAQHFNNCSSLIEALNSQLGGQSQSAQDNSPVKPGPFQGERSALWSRLMQLKNANRATPGMQARFQSIEDMVGDKSVAPETMRAMIQNLYSQMR